MAWLSISEIKNNLNLHQWLELVDFIGKKIYRGAYVI